MTSGNRHWQQLQKSRSAQANASNRHSIDSSMGLYRGIPNLATLKTHRLRRHDGKQRPHQYEI